MKTLEELKQEMDDAGAAWVLVCDIWSGTYAANTAGTAAAETAWGIAWDAYIDARDVYLTAYNKKLREVESEDT